jgi:hypothetical protein
MRKEKRAVSGCEVSDWAHVKEWDVSEWAQVSEWDVSERVMSLIGLSVSGRMSVERAHVS